MRYVAIWLMKMWPMTSVTKQCRSDEFRQAFLFFDRDRRSFSHFRLGRLNISWCSLVGVWVIKFPNYLSRSCHEYLFYFLRLFFAQSITMVICKCYEKSCWLAANTFLLHFPCNLIVFQLLTLLNELMKQSILHQYVLRSLFIHIWHIFV